MYIFEQYFLFMDWLSPGFKKIKWLCVHEHVTKKYVFFRIRHSIVFVGNWHSMIHYIYYLSKLKTVLISDF